ncbi:hypothetical protein GUITHDRAFT_163729 [Guillardia theta CCMP2712]|uniref:MATH domain-containing protein n=1 Tax=Guillardia theta (strain CCMP2712) TaxID=905079 RepID=L1J597_GUITC|nr:hypothetical protein GUITHDRAFT_163729 [Guillardia theta CCMP2712]EKX43713.1 hypothetical protein GUITHDRAFT_163729 [Guillardia theta CCMP2712]|eukprot:XP_005830693.1 hypothetical protein GUITHDRAFT_163729 [Guillardia theta CCMP2712]
MFGGSVNRVKDLKKVGDLTTFTWQVGRFRNVVVIVSTSCNNKRSRLPDPSRRDTAAFATIKVSYAPDYGDRKRKSTKGEVRSSSTSESASEVSSKASLGKSQASRYETDIQDGTFTMHHFIFKVEIFAITGVELEPPETDYEITLQGRQRTRWMIKDLEGIHSKIWPNQKISSSEFETDGSWYLDLYPKGYRLDEDKSEYLSIYLHSSRKQAEIGDTRKHSFRFGIFKVNRLDKSVYRMLEEDEEEDVYFPPGSSCVATFNADRRCFGKQCFIPLSHIVNGRLDKSQLKALKVNPDMAAQELIAGRYDAGGSITLILDMSVTDDENWMVQHMLHLIDAFDNPYMSKCSETGTRFDRSAIFGGAKGLPSPCHVCGKLFVSSTLFAGEVTRFPDWGFEVGRDFIVDILVREEENALQNVLKELDFQRQLHSAKMHVANRLTNIRKRMYKTDQEKKVKKHNNSDEEDEELPDKETATGQLLKRIEKELAEQKKFERNLQNLKQEIENAHFSKTVCSKCLEFAKEYQAARRIYAAEDGNTPTIMSKDPFEQDPNRFRWHWKVIRDYVEQEYTGVLSAMQSNIDVSDAKLVGESLKHGRNKGYMSDQIPVTAQGETCWRTEGVGKNAMTLVRGWWYGEPTEIARQCCGRINLHDPDLNDDPETPRDGFCDVRFDRRQGNSKPEMIHCRLTGKVFCTKCTNYKIPLPEYERSPDKCKTLAKVCIEAYERRQATVVRIQDVSEKPPEETVEKKVKGIQQTTVEEEDDDSEPPYVALLRKIPFCGENLADKITDE